MPSILQRFYDVRRFHDVSIVRFTAVLLRASSHCCLITINCCNQSHIDRIVLRRHHCSAADAAAAASCRPCSFRTVLSSHSFPRISYSEINSCFFNDLSSMAVCLSMFSLFIFKPRRLRLADTGHECAVAHRIKWQVCCRLCKQLAVSA